MVVWSTLCSTASQSCSNGSQSPPPLACRTSSSHRSVFSASHGRAAAGAHNGAALCNSTEDATTLGANPSPTDPHSRAVADMLPPTSGDAVLLLFAACPPSAPPGTGKPDVSAAQNSEI
eukprot:3933075-Rhodomonas_salina.3